MIPGYAPSVFNQTAGHKMAEMSAPDAINQRSTTKYHKTKSTYNATFTTMSNGTNTARKSGQSPNSPNPIMAPDHHSLKHVETHDSTEVKPFDLDTKVSRIGGNQTQGGLMTMVLPELTTSKETIQR